MSDEAIREQWDKAAQSFVEFVRSGRNYYLEHLNGPALKRMMGDVKGKKVLDIGCGEGYLSRVFAKEGAEVTGIDLSRGLIEAALEEEGKKPLGVRYLVADAAKLDMLQSRSFDIAFSHMSLMDIADYEGAVAEASRVLKLGGRFFLVIEHPCFATRLMDGRMVAGWKMVIGDDGSKDYRYYWIEDYFRRYSYIFEWKHDRLPYSFVTTGFHRTLADYINALIKHGLIITRVEEPEPTEEGVRLHPPMKKHYRVPQSIAIETRRTF